MKEDKTKNIIIVILLCIIFLLIGVLITVVVNKKFFHNETLPEIKDTFPDTIVGEWGMCDGEYSCNGIIIGLDNEENYFYNPYRMWSDGGQAGKIQDTKKVEENKYQITVYYAGFSNELAEAPEETLTYNIDISDLENNIIYVNEEKYQKITTNDREEFYNSIMK